MASTAYLRTLQDLIKTLPLQLPPSTVQQIADIAASPASDFNSEAPRAYAITLQWLVWNHKAETWTAIKCDEFYTWCKSNRERLNRLKTVQAADMTDEKQMRIAGRTAGGLCEEYEAYLFNRPRTRGSVMMV